jgi:hypothetical protein
LVAARLERHKGASDLKIVAPARTVRSYKRGTSESGDNEMISASNMLIASLLPFNCMSLRNLVILMTKRANICDLWINTHGAGITQRTCGQNLSQHGSRSRVRWLDMSAERARKRSKRDEPCGANTERDRVRPILATRTLQSSAPRHDNDQLDRCGHGRHVAWRFRICQDAGARHVPPSCHSALRGLSRWSQALHGVVVGPNGYWGTTSFRLLDEGQGGVHGCDYGGAP